MRVYGGGMGVFVRPNVGVATVSSTIGANDCAAAVAVGGPGGVAGTVFVGSVVVAAAPNSEWPVAPAINSQAAVNAITTNQE